MKIALIGFGEAGQMFAEGLRARADIYAYDINITDAMQKAATTLGAVSYTHLTLPTNREV